MKNKSDIAKFAFSYFPPTPNVFVSLRNKYNGLTERESSVFTRKPTFTEIAIILGTQPAKCGIIN